ncbi:protein ABHD18-like [Amphiura filiformis]|uniref:protein ABHD18-like n=1 Tax=Amphiura filiformis TaxID=82378 RepID=UPI003B221F2B
MWGKASKFDIVYRKLLLTNFFTKGWGSPNTLKRIFELGKILSDRSICQDLVDDNYPITIDKDEERRGCRIINGHFHSPFATLLPDIMPPEVQTARFQMVLPLSWPKRYKPLCIHLAGTGDHHFWRRRVLMARPLAKEYGIGSLLLENPYYGHRKPKDQLLSSLNNVSDLFVMGGALILESLALLHWCEKQGYGPLGLSGVSMGGHMATLAATNWHKPIPLIPCLSWSSATPVFTDGVMSGALPWNLLATQYVCHHEYEADILRKMLKCPQTDAFKLGQEFASNFPESCESLQKVQLHRGLAKIHKHNVTENSDSTKTNDKSIECNDSTKTSNVLPTEGSKKEVQSNVCNENSTNPANYTTASTYNHVMTNQSDRTTYSHVGDTSVLMKEHAQLKTFGSGMTQQSHPHVLKIGDEMTEKVLGEIDNLSFVTNQRVEVSADQCSLHHNPTRSKLEDEFLKETSNIPVNIENISNESKNAETAKPRSSNDHLRKNTTEHLQSKNMQSEDKQKAQQQAKNFESIVQKRLQKGERLHILTREVDLVSVKDEAMEFMHGVMDAATFVGNFSTPVDSSLITVIAAEQDAYIPRDKVPSLQDLWPGVEVRYINSGHVRAILFMQDHFRKAIDDTFTKFLIKYPDMY